MKISLTLAAILAWLFGLALLLIPARFYSPTGIALTPLLATIAQAHGATLFGLGTVTWLARKIQGPGLQAILGGNLIVQILSFAVAIRTGMLAGYGKIIPALVIHTVLGILFTWLLLKNKPFNKII